MANKQCALLSVVIGSPKLFQMHNLALKLHVYMHTYSKNHGLQLSSNLFEDNNM